MQVYPEFITEREEIALLNELEPQLRRMRYEFDHWDNVSGNIFLFFIYSNIV